MGNGRVNSGVPGADEGDRTPARGVARRLAALVCLLFCATLLWSTSASALIHRGHVFATTFEGAGENAFTNPSGVAVNETSGEVYVVDGGHERVESFKPDGKGGFEFVAAFPVPGAATIAIDNAAASPSHGDVYVTGVNKAPKKGEVLEEEPSYVYKFTAAGEKLFKKHLFKVKEKNAEKELEEFEVEFEQISGVAVDASGQLWVEDQEEGRISGYTNAEANKLIGSTIKEVELRSTFECRALPGFAVAPHDEAFYLRHERGNGLEECPEEEVMPAHVAKALVGKVDGSGAPLASGLDNENTSGVAVDQASGDVYVDNASSVAAFSSGGSFIERFGEGEGLSGGGALAVDSATGDIFVAESSGKVAVFKAEAAGAPPSVDSIEAQDLTPSSTRLSAQIDPRGSDTHYFFQYGTSSCATTPSACTDVPAAPGADLGSGFGDQSVEVTVEGLKADTTYFFRVIASNEHGTTESSQSAKTFFTTLPSSEGLLADNRQWEMVSPPTKGGALQSMSLEGASIQAAEGGGAITYGAEASGPVGEPQGNRSIAVTQFLSTRGPGEWSTQDIVTPHNKGEGVTPGGGETEEYRVFSSDLSVGLVEPEVRNSEPMENPPLSPPLQGGEKQEKTMYLRADPPVSPGAAEQAIYEEAAANSAYLAPGYLPLVSSINDTAGEPFGKSLEFLDATPDLKHVVFESGVPLTKGAVGDGLYEWNSASPQHALALLSVLPPVARAPKLGSYGNSRNAISSDGSRIFFSSEFASGEFEGNEGAFLFMRDTATSETVQINAAQGEHASEPGPAEQASEELDEARFQTASSDGSKAFFTDTWPLTDAANLHPTEANHPADLYEFDLGAHKLTDLTVDKNVGEGADVLGVIPGASEDGSRVYFVANGVLAAGAHRGNCPASPPLTEGELAPGATCNLYVSEPGASGRETRLIATLSALDGADWGIPPFGRVKGHEADLTYLTARVSPGSGEYLSFMSQRSLTGYNNEDATSKAADEEVYLYNATLGRLVCASCNPGGERPHGVLDTEHAGEGLGLLVDRPEVWKNRWIAGSIPGWTALGPLRSTYQSRYLAQSGRLFFNSSDALVPQDQNHKEDVYEYQPVGVGGCARPGGCLALVSSGAASDEHESAFLDASAGGGDAFFLTSERLLPQDVDKALDVYAARICGTSESSACLPPKPPPPPACTGEACKAPASGQPSFSSSATATFSGPGNVPSNGVLAEKAKVIVQKKPPTRAQRLAKALKACKKLKKKKKRVACEKQARRRYGHAKKAKTKKAKKSSARHSTSPSGRRG